MASAKYMRVLGLVCSSLSMPEPWRMERLMTTMVLALSTSWMGMPAIGEPRWRAAVCHVVRLLPATFACEVSVSIDWALLSV